MSKKIAVFNKGDRVFDLGDVVIRAKGTANLDEKLAKRLLKTYPLDIVLPRGDAAVLDTSKLDAEIKDLKAQVADLTAQLEDATKPATKDAVKK